VAPLREPHNLSRVSLRILYKAVLLPLCAFAGGAVSTLALAPSAGATGTNESPYAATLQLGRVLVEVENEYVEPVDRAKLVDGAIKGMVAELDPHSAYMPPQDFSLFESETEGKFGGVGIEVDARNDQLTIIAPIEGTPADRAGIRSGDRILAVDGQDAVGEGLDKVVRKMRGAPGTHVKLTIRREKVSELLTFDLVREEIHVPSVASRLLVGNVAYVRVKQFQEHTHDEIVEAAGKLRAEAKAPLTGVILDMRSDPGGLVDEAAEVADEFLASGTIYTTRHRGQVIDDVTAKGGGAFTNVPVVVLVNEYSASAAELVAGALQDNQRAKVVGAQTFGKGSVQAIIGLPGGAGLRLTTARYYTPSGRSIQAEGIHPDVLVESKRDEAGQIPIVRERDLEGHLPAEGRAGSTEATIAAPPDGGTVLEGMRSDASNVPRDPSSGNDFVLRTGYELLRGTLNLPVRKAAENR
jgi:carboxyl-terminal processing protease